MLGCWLVGLYFLFLLMAFVVLRLLVVGCWLYCSYWLFLFVLLFAFAAGGCYIYLSVVLVCRLCWCWGYVYTTQCWERVEESSDTSPAM